jgi:hypothetical protein
MFFNTGTNKHSQELNLAAGSYKYYIKCVDLGGNSDKKTVSFGVETDTYSPAIVRVYHEESYLKIVTSEKGECVYSKDSCTYQFSDGIKMATPKENEHYTDWNTNINYYIKCRDGYGNEPFPNVCSITVRPTQLFGNATAS